MRKTLRVSQETFVQALENLGYHKLKPRTLDRQDWKRQRFHIIFRQRKGNLHVDLHIDLLAHMIDKIHRSKKQGKEIEEELERIIREYGRLRDVGE